MSTFALATRPSNTAAHYFLPEISLKPGQWAEVFAAIFGFTTLAALNTRHKVAKVDKMLDAEAILLDPAKVKRRLTDFDVEPTPKLLTKIQTFLGDFWSKKRREKAKPCPRFVMDLAEYLAGADFAREFHHPPTAYFAENGKVQVPSAYRGQWNGRILSASAPQLPMGELKPTDPTGVTPESLVIPVQLQLTDEDLEILSPHNRAKLGDGKFFAYLFLTLVGPRGVSYDDIVFPDERMTEPLPWLDHIEANTLAAKATEEDDEDMDNDDPGEEEDDEFALPEGATCVNHPDTPAVEVWDGEPLCEDCAEHYVDGYRPRD